MTDTEVQLRGAVIALNTTFSYLTALHCKDHPDALDEFFSTLTGHIEDAMQRTRETVPATGHETVNALETSAIAELNALFVGAKRLLERAQAD